jgi:hypothetical protein
MFENDDLPPALSAVGEGDDSVADLHEHSQDLLDYIQPYWQGPISVDQGMAGVRTEPNPVRGITPPIKSAGTQLGLPVGDEANAHMAPADDAAAPPEAPLVLQPIPNAKWLPGDWVDRSVITRLEGGNRLDLYAVGPTIVRGPDHRPIMDQDGKPVLRWHDRSGVTGGVGFDFGQHDEHDLKGLGASDAEIASVKGYLAPNAPQGSTAASYVAQHPLRLDPAFADKLNKGALDATINAISARYNHDVKAANSAAANPAPAFHDLTPERQTTVASMAYQMGPKGLPGSRFWPYILNSDWDGLRTALNADTSNDSARRHSEANYLPSAGP